MAPVTRGKGRAARPSDLSQVPKPPRIKLLVGTSNLRGKKRPLPAPEAQTRTTSHGVLETEFQVEELPATDSGSRHGSKKSKYDAAVLQRFLLTCIVTFENKVLVEETELKTPGAFNYQEFASLEAKKIGLHAMRKKINLTRLRGRAIIRYGAEPKQGKMPGFAASGKGAGSVVTRSVDGPEDWEKVEAMALEWIVGGKKDVRVELRVEYRVPQEEGEESDSSEDPYSEDITILSTQKSVSKRKPRRTATTIMREEMEKQQREERSYVPDLMQRWRCQNKVCKQFPDNACLVLAHEKQCRPLNSHILGIWDGKIKRGECTEHSFPLDIKMPPLSGDRSTKSAVSAPILQPQTLPMQISVTAPPPQIPPWWLPNTTTLSHPAHNFSSPIRAHGSSSTELLNQYTEWFKSSLTPGNDAVLEAVENAIIALKKEMYDLEGLRTMDVIGWKELKVPVGLGSRMSKGVKEFKRIHRL